MMTSTSLDDHYNGIKKIALLRAGDMNLATAKRVLGPSLTRALVAEEILVQLDKTCAGGSRDAHITMMLGAMVQRLDADPDLQLPPEPAARPTDQELLSGTRWEGDPNATVRHGLVHDKRYDRQ